MHKLEDKAATSVHKIVPPFAATCRAEPITGVGGYSRCLVDVNIICGYRTNPFSLGPFCLHPRHSEIVARTTSKIVPDQNLPVRGTGDQAGFPPSSIPSMLV